MGYLIFVPAYNAAATLCDVIKRIPRDVYCAADGILLQDDGSTDNTFGVALALARDFKKITVVRNSHNMGYGGTKKKAYSYCLANGYNAIVMVHGDGQHDPEYITSLLAPILERKIDVVLGSRMLGKPVSGGMPLWKWVGNKTLTWIANRALGLQLTDYHTGYRAYSRHALAALDLPTLNDGHGISFDIICRAVREGLSIAEVGVPTYYGIGSRSISLVTCLHYGCYVSWAAIKWSCSQKDRRYKAN